MLTADQNETQDQPKDQPPNVETFEVCTLDELPIGLGRAFTIAGRSIAIFRTRKEKLLAVDNRCPHKAGPLADGMLAGDQIVCPLHAFRFDGITGECDQPGQCPVQAHVVTEKDKTVYIQLSGSSCEATAASK